MDASYNIRNNSAYSSSDAEQKVPEAHEVVLKVASQVWATRIWRICRLLDESLLCEGRIIIYTNPAQLA